MEKYWRRGAGPPRRRLPLRGVRSTCSQARPWRRRCSAWRAQWSPAAIHGVPRRRGGPGPVQRAGGDSVPYGRQPPGDPGKAMEPAGVGLRPHRRRLPRLPVRCLPNRTYDVAALSKFVQTSICKKSDQKRYVSKQLLQTSIMSDQKRYVSMQLYQISICMMRDKKAIYPSNSSKQVSV